jgi:flotillin
MQVCLTLPLCSGTSFLLSLPLYCSTNVHAALYSEQKAADAHAYKVQIEIEARFLAAAKDADALLVRQQKEAAGMSAMAGAYTDLSRAFGGPASFIQYLAIEKGIYTQLAKANADAVRGLNPKMTIWNTGNSIDPILMEPSRIC